MVEADFITLIMAGGSGTRFFPLSRRTYPKQYLRLFGERTLLQQTLDRVLPITEVKKIYICSTENQVGLIQEQAPKKVGVILEPAAKNTAPCLMLSTIQLLREGYSPQTPMVVLPADHFIEDDHKFQNLLQQGVKFATENNSLVTLGIFPTTPHTGYGYIEAGDAFHQSEIFKVKRFVEKPNKSKAEKFLKNRNFYWNGGIFIWTLHAIAEAFQQFLPEAWERMNAYQSEEDLQRIYESLDAIPIDVAVLEKAHNVFVIPADMGWNDVGSWNALYELKTKNHQDHVVLSGEVHSIQSRGCLINLDSQKQVALVGVDNLIVVEKDNVLLIADRDQDQLVREAAKELDPPPQE